jgi:hypothetical protein
MWVYEPQIRIVNHDHIIVITWLGTHIIVHESKRSNLRKSTFKLKIHLFVFTKNLAKQLALIAKGILKLDDYKGKTLSGWIITYIGVRVGDVSRRLANEAKAGEVGCLALGLLILLWAEESSLEKSRMLRAAHAWDIIFWNFLFFFLSPKRYFFLPSPLSLESFRLLKFYLLEELNFFRLGQSVMKWVVSPHSKQPLDDLLLSLWNLCKAWNFLPSGQSRRRGCPCTAHQKLWLEKTKQAPKPMSQ